MQIASIPTTCCGGTSLAHEEILQSEARFAMVVVVVVIVVEQKYGFVIFGFQWKISTL